MKLSQIIYAGICSWLLVGLGVFVGHEIVTAFGWHPAMAYTIGEVLVWSIAVLLLLEWPDRRRDE